MKTKSWYKKRMPRVAEVKKDLIDLANELQDIKGVSRIYAWGSLAENYNNSKASIKEIDVMLKTSFFSEDLISINDSGDSPMRMSEDKLENFGYDVDAVNFTKQLIKLNSFNFKKWVISSDNKILHWGGIPESIEEWYEIKKEAEEYAEIATNCSSEKIKTKPVEIQNKWATTYEHKINKYLSGMPKGWYPLNLKVKDIQSNLIELKEGTDE